MSRAQCRTTLMAAAVFAVYSWPGDAAERQIIGYIEDVRIFPGDAPFTAKIDSGADNSSIDVGAFEEFERDGRRWVRFVLTGADGAKVTVERPVLRIVKVRRSGTDTQRRYVINIGVCLGRHYEDAEANLNMRGGMGHRMLIGRHFLGDRFLIDTAAKHLTKPDCPGAPRP
jgi:hypothetical protein